MNVVGISQFFYISLKTEEKNVNTSRLLSHQPLSGGTMQNDLSASFGDLTVTLEMFSLSVMKSNRIEIYYIYWSSRSMSAPETKGT